MENRKKTNRIGWQLFWLILLTIVLPSVAFFTGIVNRYSQDLISRAITTRQSVLEEINRCIKLCFNDYQELSMTIYYDAEIKDFIDSGAYKDPSEEQLKFLEKSMLAIINSKYRVDKLMLCFGDNIYEYGRSFSGMDEYRDKYELEVLERKGRSIWLPTEIMQGTLYRKPKAFTLARAINNAESKNVGTFYMFLSDNFFSQIMTNNILTSDNSHYYIIGQGGQIVTSDTELVGTAGELPFDIEAMTEDTGFFKVGSGKSAKVVTYAKMKSTGWISVIISDSNAISSNARTVKKFAAIFMLLYVSALGMGYLLTNRTIIMPINKLYVGMRKVSHGQFESVTVPRINNEIKQLTIGFNDMVSHIQTLLCRVRDEEAEKNHQRIKVLYMQVGPHFLYNTLNSIKWMAVLNNQTNIKLMIDSLMKLMAGVAYNKDDHINVERELELLDSYICIQKVRFTNFTVDYDIPDELKKLQIGRFMLQPFVENSILHGLCGIQYPGVIKIRAFLDNALRIEITDNGRGFDVNAIAEHSNNIDEKDHVGIRNVQERIAIHYGGDYGINIQSGIGSGTKVSLCLPIIEERENM